MAKIHINRNRQTIGQFSRDEVEDGLRSGRFLPDDLAWREPMETWLPLSEIPEFNLSKADESLEVPSVEALPTLTEPAWERRSEAGFFPALVDTVWQVLSNPAGTFRNMKPDGGLLSPLLFYIVTGWVAQCVAFAYSRVISSVIAKYEPSQQIKNLPASWLYLEQHPAVYVIVAPFSLAIGVFLMAAFYHLCLMIFGGANKSFEVTFRVCAYALGATVTFMLIPLCGSYIYLAYLMVVLCIGIKEAHQTTYAKAIGVVAVSVLLCCGLVLGAATVVAGAALHDIK